MTQISIALARKIAQTIATEIGAQDAQVHAAVALLDEGATVPFIARYRKEVTGGLDDTQLRNLEVRLTYLRELEERRATVLASGACLAVALALAPLKVWRSPFPASSFPMLRRSPSPMPPAFW